MKKKQDEKAVEARITKVLHAIARDQELTENPMTPYLRRHLAEHAVAAGRIDSLLTDDAYVLQADMRRLLQAANSAVSATGQRRARMLRLTPHAIPAGPTERAAQFSVTEAFCDLGTSYREGHWNAPYRARWAQVKPRHERTLLTGHSREVWAVCPVSVAGQTMLASGGDDGTVRIWDPATGQQHAVIEGNKNWSFSCAR